MFWTFFISGSIIALFTSFKIWEEKNSRETRLSRFLASQDYKFEKLAFKFVSLWRSLERFLKFFFFIKVPFYLHLIARKIIAGVSGEFRSIKDYVRGKYLARRRGKTSSDYLKGISKFKKNLDKKRIKNIQKDF